jgi:hypothetical protein
MTSNIKIPNYSSSEFVGRQDKVEQFLSKASDFIQGKDINHRTTIFMGERGIGKSWLMNHLKHRLTAQSDNQFSVFFVDLHKYSGQDITVVLLDILNKFAQQILPDLKITDPTLAGVSREVMATLKDKVTEQPLVVFVDTVYEREWEFLEELENYFIGPLAIEPGVMIVMAGRGQEHPWTTLELAECEVIPLDTFDIPLTKEQLSFYERGNLAETVHELSGGNPLANYLLAIYPDNPEKALDLTIKIALSVVPAEDDPTKIRDYLQAVSVLQSFDNDRILEMLKVYSEREDWDYRQVRKIRKQLIKLGFAKSEGQGLVMDNMLRQIIENYLRLSQNNKWRDLHTAASALYNEWQSKFSEQKEQWQTQFEYHEQQLQFSS